LVVTAFTADEIVPGEYFDLELTIENLGDDTARDVFITIPFDGTEEYPWLLEEEFKRQFQWDVFGDWVEVDNFAIPDDMFYTVEDLDVDNIREIVEINLYMDGVYSDPGSTIEIIKIVDLGPGETTSATFTMIADKDMVNGKPYNVEITFNGINSMGTGVIAPQEHQTLEVMSSQPGDSYNPVELDWFGIGMKALLLLLFLVIVLAILLMVLNKFKGDGDDYDDDDDFGFEDEEDDEFAFEAKNEPASPPPESPENLVEP